MRERHAGDPLGHQRAQPQARFATKLRKQLVPRSLDRKCIPIGEMPQRAQSSRGRFLGLVGQEVQLRLELRAQETELLGVFGRVCQVPISGTVSTNTGRACRYSVARRFDSMSL